MEFRGKFCRDSFTETGHRETRLDTGEARMSQRVRRSQIRIVLVGIRSGVHFSLKALLEQRDILWLKWKVGPSSGPGPIVITNSIHAVLERTACPVQCHGVYIPLS